MTDRTSIAAYDRISVALARHEDDGGMFHACRACRGFQRRWLAARDALIARGIPWMRD